MRGAWSFALMVSAMALIYVAQVDQQSSDLRLLGDVILAGLLVVASAIFILAETLRAK